MPNRDQLPNSAQNGVFGQEHVQEPRRLLLFAAGDAWTLNTRPPWILGQHLARRGSLLGPLEYRTCFTDLNSSTNPGNLGGGHHELALH